MKVLPIFSFILALGAAWFFLFGSNVEGELSENPTLYASDVWDVWERWDSSELPVDGAEWWNPAEDEVLYKFSNSEHFVFHVSRNIDSLKLNSKHYRGGYLVGSEVSLNLWSDNPGFMSEKWKVSAESYIRLSEITATDDSSQNVFKLESGDERIVVWGDSINIEGFVAHIFRDRVVYTRVGEIEEFAIDQLQNDFQAENQMSESILMMGVTRNHRTGSDMDIVWNEVSYSVEAIGGGGDVVWSKVLSEKPLGESFEVDLYSNNKYQTAFATSSAVYLLDVTGKDVRGYPYEADITGFAVFDYDRNDKYRFLVATSSGKLINLKDEGRVTTGWNFKHLKGGNYIEHLAHLRVGARDYIYGGCYDGSVLLLKRTGQVRGSTPVRVAPISKPAFRISNTIGKTTVLFIDSSGWLRELTLAEAEPVGISGLTRADRVSLQDLDGDGKLEVVITLDGVRSVWNSRNELVL